MLLRSCLKQDETKIRRLYRAFDPITRESGELFRRLGGNDSFGDTRFSLLYAWDKSFDYGIRPMENAIAVVENGVDDRIACILIKNSRTNMPKVMKELSDIFREVDIPLIFSYVEEEQLKEYANAAGALGKSIQAESIRGDSDYIYLTEEFISLSGGINKRKRQDVNALLKKYPDISLKLYSKDNKDFRNGCLRVFDSWCGSYPCRDCVYGCERRALTRFFDVFDPSIHTIGAAFTEGRMLSFAVSERINSDTVAYYFQKNMSRERGLTYWLNREMALLHRDVRYINLGEDMELEGLRQDKLSFHPCLIRDKYTVKILKGKFD